MEQEDWQSTWQASSLLFSLPPSFPWPFLCVCMCVFPPPLLSLFLFSFLVSLHQDCWVFRSGDSLEEGGRKLYCTRRSSHVLQQSSRSPHFIGAYLNKWKGTFFFHSAGDSSVYIHWYREFLTVLHAFLLCLTPASLALQWGTYATFSPNPSLVINMSPLIGPPIL